MLKSLDILFDPWSRHVGKEDSAKWIKKISFQTLPKTCFHLGQIQQCMHLEL
jgi:hypothetical protein